MTVRIFVSRDSEERPWAPDYTHEARAAQEIIKRLWASFHHLPFLYAVIANLHEPSADMVIITERGIGVVELKHYAGKIAIGPDGTWFAGGRAIQAGVHANPHRQVQAYAKSIRQQTLMLILPKWLQRKPTEWDAFKLQTSVCFTNPNARIEEVRAQIAQPGMIHREPWENDFSVIVPTDVPDWAANLRFQLDMGRQKRFEPYRLEASTVVNVVTLRFGATEWREILELMPAGEPYAFLVLSNDQKPLQTFGLHRDEVVVGRDPNRCDIVVPGSFSRVSRVHARILREVDSVIIQDQSTHGTFCNGKAIRGRHALSHGQAVTLGGVRAGKKVCELSLELREYTDVELPETEAASGVT